MKSQSKVLFNLFVATIFVATLTASPIFATPVRAANLMVTTTVDEMTNGNGCSLREAITNANNDLQSFPDCPAGSGADTITFDNTLGTATIILGSELPSVSDLDGLTINGGGDITVSGNNLYRVFKVSTNRPLTIDQITVANGEAPGPSTPVGGGIHNGGILTVSNSTFTNNHSDGIGGAILNYGTINITGSTFTGNTAIQAGAIHNGGDGSSTISNSTFTNNSAINSFDGKGGAIYTQEPLNITNSTFINNSAEIGAAIYDYEGSLNVANSTFSSNDAVNWGGGIFNALDGSLVITNSTFSGNTAGLYGGGVYGSASSIMPAITIQTTLYNTVLADNTAGIDGANCYDSITNGGNNLEDDTDCGWNSNDGSMSSTDPLLGPLANNGGSTQTFALTSNSPAINAGDDTVCAAAPVNNTSQNGIARPQGTHCDIGSFELATDIEVIIGGVTQGTYTLGPGSSQRVNYAGLDSGPVKVVSEVIPIIAAIRDAWAVNGVTTSFSQLMGLPVSQVSDKYVFPAYNNVTLDEQLRIANVDTVSTTVTVTIGGVLQGTYDLDQDEAVRINYAGLDSGPVIVDGTDGVDIIAAIRDAWAVNGVTTSFSQLMGMPAGALSDTYIFPAYNNVTLNEQLRIGNVDTVPTTVTVTIGGVLQGSYDLDPDEAVRINYAGLDSGPVVVQGTDNVDIIAAIREAWAVNGVTQSFIQLMGLPFEQLSLTYLFPAYNNVTLNEQIRFAVP